MTIDELVDEVKVRSPRHAKKLDETLDMNDENYTRKANVFLEKYDRLLSDQGLDMNYAIDCYFEMVNMVLFEHKEFLHTENYRYSSFDEVRELVYDNVPYMKRYMNGLILSQFLWLHHYKMVEFQSNELPYYKGKVNSYLEIGGGHGLFLSSAHEILGEKVHFTCVDLSASSLEMCKNFNSDIVVNYVKSDINDFETKEKFDFISMGEVLEHVEEPTMLMAKLWDLVSDDGTVFITVPTNAPVIDHIYLFRNAQEIIDICEKVGFEVIKDMSFYAEDVDAKRADKMKVAMMYACYLKKKKTN